MMDEDYFTLYWRGWVIDVGGSPCLCLLYILLVRNTTDPTITASRFMTRSYFFAKTVGVGKDGESLCTTSKYSSTSIQIVDLEIM